MFAAAAGLLLLDELLLLPHPAASTPASRATATIDTTAMDIRLVRDDHRSMLPPLGHGSGCDWVACGWIPRPRAANPAPLAWRRPRWGSSVRKGRDASLESGGGANNTHAARFTSPFRVSVASPVRCLAPAYRADVDAPPGERLRDWTWREAASRSVPLGPGTVPRGSQQISQRARTWLPSVKEVVDRSGIEPLTSSVQAHQLVC